MPVLTPLLLGTLGFTASVSAIATDVSLASFGSIQHDLGTSVSTVQLTLAVFMFGLGAGHVVIGPLSDSRGRRGVLLGALTIFAISGIATVFTPNIETLVALRLVQGFSGAAGIVIARAIAADLSIGPTAVRALSLIAMVSALGPLVGAPLGGITHELWGWRGTLATVALASCAMLALSWLIIPESLPPRNRRPGGIRHTVSSFAMLVRNPIYVLFVLACALGFAAMIAYIAASPFVGQAVLEMSPLVYSLAFAAGGTALITMNLVNSRIAPHIGPTKMLLAGVGTLLFSGTALLALALTDTLEIWSFVACAFVLTAGAGATLSNGSALALAEAAHARGAGAALLGLCQYPLAGVVAPIVGAWGEHTALPMAVTVLAAALLSASCATCAIVLSRRLRSALPMS